MSSNKLTFDCVFQIKSSDGLPLTLCISCVQRLNRRHTLQMKIKQAATRGHLLRRVQSTTTSRECNQQIHYSSDAAQSI